MKQECKTSKSAELFIVSCEIITTSYDKKKHFKKRGVIEKKFEEQMKKKHGVRDGISICRRQTPCSMVRAYFIPMCAE